MKAPRLSVSGIEYLDYAWNFYSGCENQMRGICSVPNCWARSITERFPAHYPNGFNPTFYIDAFLSPMSLKKPSRIGVAFMGDLFGDWVNLDEKISVALYGLDERSIELAKVGINPVPPFPLKEAVFTTIRCCPQHTFLFLTKCPWNLPKWSPFPDNCQVGATVTNQAALGAALAGLAVIDAKVKFLSFEPLLGQIGIFHYLPLMLKNAIDWVIIGAQTKPTVEPKIEWVQEIALACTKAHIPLFLKDNLKSLLPNRMPFWGGVSWIERDKGVPISMSENRYRQEFPNATP